MDKEELVKFWKSSICTWIRIQEYSLTLRDTFSTLFAHISGKTDNISMKISGKQVPVKPESHSNPASRIPIRVLLFSPVIRSFPLHSTTRVARDSTQ